MSLFPAASHFGEGDIDVQAVAKWLSNNVDGYVGPLEIERFDGGQSNPTYLLRTPSSSYVLRRKPIGLVHPSAHAIDREFRLLEALDKTAVPVPYVLGLCTDDNVIGSWFYVMEHMHGRVLRDATMPEIAPELRSDYLYALTDALAALHLCDVDGIGLGDFGRPGSYVERQIARFARQYRADEAAGRCDAMDNLIDWLSANRPEAESRSVVHGDYKFDNVMFDSERPVVKAVLDWELATVGDPLADFGYFAMMYRMPPGLATSVLSNDRVVPGLPAERQLVEYYCRLTRREDIANLDFYIAFNMFRLAAILHGIRARLIAGTASSPSARTHAANFEAMAELAWGEAMKNDHR